MFARLSALRESSFRFASVFLLATLPAEAGKAGTAVLVAVNQEEASLSIIDPQSGAQLAKVVQGAITGHEVAVSADGRIAYVPIYGDSSVGEPGSAGQELIAVDIATGRVLNRLDFGRGVRPHCVVLNPHDGMLYITTELDHTVTVVDPQKLKIVGAIPTGQSESHMLTISHDGRFGYVSNVGPGTVSVLDLQTQRLVAIIPVSERTERISISADDQMVFTADQARPRLAVIDTRSNSVKAWVPLPATGFGTASTHDGRWLLAAVRPTSQIAVVDLKTLQVVRSIPVPPTPIAIVVAPDDRTAYVSCGKSARIAAISLSDWTVQRLIEAGRHVDGLAWAAAQEVR
jgi:DNA-binding beta-propeller fold protein YncE